MATEAIMDISSQTTCTTRMLTFLWWVWAGTVVYYWYLSSEIVLDLRDQRAIPGGLGFGRLPIAMQHWLSGSVSSPNLESSSGTNLSFFLSRASLARNSLQFGLTLNLNPNRNPFHLWGGDKTRRLTPWSTQWSTLNEVPLNFCFGQVKYFIDMPKAFRCTYPYLFRAFQQDLSSFNSWISTSFGENLYAYCHSLVTGGSIELANQDASRWVVHASNNRRNVHIHG